MDSHQVLPGFFIIAVIVFIGTTSFQAAEVILSGKINDEYRLVADGEVYELPKHPSARTWAVIISA